MAGNACTDPARQSSPPWPQPLRDGRLAPKLLAARVGAGAAKQGAVAAGDDALAGAGCRLRDEGGQARVADFGAAHCVLGGGWLGWSRAGVGSGWLVLGRVADGGLLGQDDDGWRLAAVVSACVSDTH